MTGGSTGEIRETSCSEPVEENGGLALLVLAERLIKEYVRGRALRQNDSMV